MPARNIEQLRRFADAQGGAGQSDITQNFTRMGRLHPPAGGRQGIFRE